MSSGTGIVWDFGTSLLSTYDGDGFLYAQPDAEGEQESGVAPYQTHFPPGLWARMLDPNVDSSGNPDPSTAHWMLHALEGGQGHAFPLDNPLEIALLPNIEPGEKLFYGPKGQFIKAVEDGSFELWAPGPNGQPDFVATMGPDGVLFAGRWGKFSIDDNGVQALHSSGGQMTLGGIGGLPAPVGSVSSYFRVQAGSIVHDGAAVSAGAAAGTADMPVPSGIAVLTALSAIVASLGTIAASIASANTATVATGAFAASAAALGPEIAILTALLAPPVLFTNLTATQG